MTNKHRDGDWVKGVSQAAVRFPRESRRVMKSSLIVVINIISTILVLFTVILMVVMKPEDL